MMRRVILWMPMVLVACTQPLDDDLPTLSGAVTETSSTSPTGTPPDGTTTTMGGTSATSVADTTTGPTPGTTSGTEGSGTTVGVGETTGSTSLGESTGSTDAGSSSSESTGGPLPDCHPVLAEVFYDASGADSGDEWIKLHNPCPAAIDLGTYSLGWGGASYVVGQADLSGMLAVDDCAVVGGPNSDAGNGMPVYTLVEDFSPNLQNAGPTADGIALFDSPSVGVDAATVPVDAVIYGGANGNNLLDDDGLAGVPHVGDASPGESVRLIAMDTWTIEANPMPGLCPPF